MTAEKQNLWSWMSIKKGNISRICNNDYKYIALLGNPSCMHNCILKIRTGHFGFAILLGSLKSYFQVSPTIKKITCFPARPIKITYLQTNSLDKKMQEIPLFNRKSCETTTSTQLCSENPLKYSVCNIALTGNLLEKQTPQFFYVSRFNPVKYLELDWAWDSFVLIRHFRVPTQCAGAQDPSLCTFHVPAFWTFKLTSFRSRSLLGTKFLC